jgi:hypothetical protein
VNAGPLLGPSGRRVGLRVVLRRQCYEAGAAVACLSGAVEAFTGRGSTVAALVFPWWGLRLAGLMLAGGGACTLAGLGGAGLLVDDVRRVLARRVEQLGQFVQAILLVVLGAGALSRGYSGVIFGAVFCGVGVGALVRGWEISKSFADAGKLL